MSELTRLRDEADRLLTTYVEYRDCNDLVVKTRVHVELDRFLMKHRETAALLMLEGLDAEIERLKGELHLDYERKPNVFSRIWKRLRRDDSEDQPSEPNDRTDTDQPKYFS